MGRSKKIKIAYGISMSKKKTAANSRRNRVHILVAILFFSMASTRNLKKHNLEVAKPKTLKETLYTNEQVRRVNFTATCKGLAGPEGKC